MTNLGFGGEVPLKAPVEWALAGRPDLGDATGDMAKITRLTLDSSGGPERRRLHLREISDDADAPLETVGQDLRKARQRKGEDLAQISGVLKIRKDHLDALEESHFDALPGRAYAIGFVRSYADYLGLNGRECVERLKAEIAGRNEAKDAVQVSTPRERKLPPGGVAIALVLLILVVWGIYTLFVWANRVAAPSVTPVPARLSAQAGLTPTGARARASTSRPRPRPPLPPAAPVSSSSPPAGTYARFNAGWRTAAARYQIRRPECGLADYAARPQADTGHRARSRQTSVARPAAAAWRFLSRSQHGRPDAIHLRRRSSGTDPRRQYHWLCRQAGAPSEPQGCRSMRRTSRAAARG